MGRLNSTLILTLVFFLVFTSAGILMRVFGYDPLRRNWKKKKDTYWIPREPVPFDPARVERQY